MPKLNESIRSKIVSAALADALNTRREALVKRESDLAKKVVADVLGSKMIKLLAGLPSGVVPTRSNISVQFATSYTTLDCDEWLRLPADKCQYSTSVCLQSYDALHPLSEEYASFKNDEKQLETDHKQLKVNLDALLRSVTTTEKLLVAWPEAKSYLPEIVELPRALPAVLAKDITDMISRAKEAA